MKILAFDLATNTGVAFGGTSGVPIAMTYVLGDAGAKHGARFTELLIVTRKLIKQFEPDVIVIEEAIAGGAVGDKNRVRLAMGLRAIVLSAAFVANITTHELPVSTIRKHFIGQGNLPGEKAKQATVSRCERLGWPVRNDNEADALAAWDYARCRLVKTSTLPPNGLFEHANNRADPSAKSRANQHRG